MRSSRARSAAPTSPLRRSVPEPLPRHRPRRAGRRAGHRRATRDPGALQPDVDHDLRGDPTEDRTDLQLGLLRRSVPTAAGGPRSRCATPGRFQPISRLLKATGSASRSEAGSGPRFALAPLAVGETRTLTLDADLPVRPGAVGLGQLEAPTSPRPTIAHVRPRHGALAPRSPPRQSQSLRKGIKVDVERARAPPRPADGGLQGARPHGFAWLARSTLAPNAARTVTVRATGAKLRSLKRALKRC